MDTHTANRLDNAASAYLRSARHQPVDWQEWSEAAFAQAQREDKPVLLDIGAVWCHWCHVMDRESYEDPETAAFINESFVAIKVDRDERPDVDARYQAAVAAISGQGGWPLTAVLTPDGRPFFGGTYFPPEDGYGRPSLRRVLGSMAEAYRSRRGEVHESATSVLHAVEENETFAEPGGPLDNQLLDRMLTSMLGQFDARNGGFGSQPKFPHAAALDLLLDAATRPGPLADRALEVVELSLQRMAAGGIHDQLAGGFHRYSVDERWVVPHFEKMAYDNSEMLRVYAHAFQSLRDQRYARVAAKTIHWMDATLTDRERGGFFASQDADASLDDDGDYFTWTRAEAAAVLSPEEMAVAEGVYSLRPVGHMHHNPAKNVLHQVGDLETVAAKLGLPQAVVAATLQRAHAKLFAARLDRPAPFVDRTIYAGWNGLCISAYLAASRALAQPEISAFALRSLDRVLAAAWNPALGLQRVVAYADDEGTPQPIPAVLDDYTALASAALDAWETTGHVSYFEAGKAMVDRLLAHFWDEAAGGCFDTAHSDRQAALGALRTRRKPLQDAPTPAGNAVLASLLLRLHQLTGEPHYQEEARQTLEAFAGVAEHLGLYAASYAQALRRFLSPPVQVCVVGEGSPAEALTAAAIERFALNKTVIRLHHDHLQTLPAALAETLPHLPGLDDGALAVVCTGGGCLPPAHDPEALLAQLQAAV